MRYFPVLKNLLLAIVLSSGFVVSAELPATVNINVADADTIAAVLTGVGKVRAQSIIKWRESNGPFTSTEQLAEVSGVGAIVLEKNKHKIVLE